MWNMFTSGINNTILLIAYLQFTQLKLTVYALSDYSVKLEEATLSINDYYSHLGVPLTPQNDPHFTGIDRMNKHNFSLSKAR
jgi:hypothetical protein